MLSENLPLLAAILVTLTAYELLVAVDWRVSLGCLALQYFGVFVLVSQEWPLVMALTRLVAGWFAGAVLGMAIVGLPDRQQVRKEMPVGWISAKNRRSRWLAGWFGAAPGPLFYLFTTMIVILAILSQMHQVLQWAPSLEPPEAWGSLILICLGLIKLGFWDRPIQAVLGLMTMFSGFEIIYAALNPAPLTAALTASINLGLALVGAYLLLAPYMESKE